jgi:hypothetical protein
MTRDRKVFKVVALLLVFALVQLYVMVSSTASSVYAQASASQGSGILSTIGNRNILADKTEVSTGATILNGQTLETSDCVSATVRWGADEVHLATNSSAVVEHGDGKLKVTLKQGCASVRVGQDVEATIETPDGKVTSATQLDGSNRKSAQVCVGSGSNSDFNPSCGGGGFPKTGWILAGVAGAIAVVVLIVSNSRGENPSTSTP